MPPSNTALIAGPSAGVGAVDADLLARRDQDSIMVARDKVRLQSLVKRLRKATGWRLEALRADLTGKENPPGTSERCAGIAAGGTLPDNEPDHLEVMV